MATQPWETVAVGSKAEMERMLAIFECDPAMQGKLRIFPTGIEVRRTESDPFVAQWELHLQVEVGE